MPIIDLFKHRSVSTTLTGPVMSRWDHSPGVEPQFHSVSDGEALVTIEYAGREDLSGSNAVLGLIGTAPSVEDRQSRSGSGGSSPDADDLIDVLYAQYCQALDNPQASVAGDWVAPGKSPDGRDGDLLDPRLPTPGNQREPVAGMESIEALLFGTHLMEHAFGPLGGGEAANLIAIDSVPEILRLFAPAEFHAAVARRPAALPPALSRREHHSLSIDSAMSVPQSTPNYGEAL